MRTSSNEREHGPEFFITQNWQKHTISVSPQSNILPLNLFNPQNIKFLRGEQAHIADETTVLYWLGLAFLVLTIIPAVAAVFMWFNSWQLQQATQTRATVTNKDMYVSDVPYSGKTIHYSLTYTFDVSNKNKATSYSAQQGVNASTYNTVNQGSSITIAYVPSDPNNSKIVGDDYNQQQIIWAGLLIALFLPFTLYLLPTVYRKEQIYRYLAEQGVLLRGEVIKSTDSGCFGIFTLQVKYRFVSPTSNLIKGKFWGSYTILQKRKMPSHGTDIIVVYINDKSYTIL